MVVLDDRDVRLLLLILELVFTLLLLFLLLFLVLLPLLLFTFAFLLFLINLRLLLEFVDALPLPDLVVVDDTLTHLVVVGVDELTQNLLLLLVLLLELLIQLLDLADLGRQLEVVALQGGLLRAQSLQLLHQTHIVGLHVAENDELLRIGQDLHLHQVQITLQLVFGLLETLQLNVKLLHLPKQLLL
jgi:hypothetical protein